MPSSENKSVKSSRSSRSRRSSNSYRHKHNFAESSDEEERLPVRTEFSHRSRSQKQTYVRNTSPPSHVEYSSDREQEDDDDASDNLTEEDSNLRISSLLMSSNNANVEKSPVERYSNKSSHATWSEGTHDSDNINENIGAGTSRKNQSSNRSDIINSVASRAVRRADACTMRMGEIMDHLYTALDLVQSYDKLNVLQEMEQWKERAIRAERMHDEMAQEIQALKKEVITWENRTRRAEKRCERLQNGDHDKDLHYSNMYNHNVESSINSEIATKPSVDVKALIQGKSFRDKWDRKRIAGIEEEIRQVSDGESTIAAREYINQFIESSPKPVAREQESRDDGLKQERNGRKRRDTVRQERSPQVVHQQQQTHHQHALQQVGHSLEAPENDNSWVEMLSI